MNTGKIYARVDHSNGAIRFVVWQATNTAPFVKVVASKYGFTSHDEAASALYEWINENSHLSVSTMP